MLAREHVKRPGDGYLPGRRAPPRVVQGEGSESGLAVCLATSEVIRDSTGVRITARIEKPLAAGAGGSRFLTQAQFVTVLDYVLAS